MENAIQIITTTDSKAAAERIARELVEQRLAACVQIGGPITSVYRWQGKMETAEEWTCTIKTVRPSVRGRGVPASGNCTTTKNRKSSSCR